MNQQQNKKIPRQSRKKSPSLGLAKQIDGLMSAEEKSQRKYHALEMRDVQRMMPGKVAPKSRAKKPVYRVKQVVIGPKNEKKDAVEVSAPVTRMVLKPHGPTDGVSAAQEIGIDPGATFTSMLNLKHPWTSAVFNGIAEADCRYPDPFTLARTSILQTRLAISVIPAAISDYVSDYSNYTYGVFKGSGTNTFSYAASTQTQRTDSAHFDTYNSSTNPAGQIWNSMTAAASTQLTRPNGMVLTIKPLLRGVEHSVTVCAFPIGPTISTSITAAPAGWPAIVQDFTHTITPSQATWGGRVWTFCNADEAIKLVSLPLDARCLDFYSGTSERLAYLSASATSWTGWVWWVYGLTNNDVVSLSCNAVEELYNPGSTTTIYAFPSNVRPANTSLAERSVNEALKLAAEGLTGTKWTTVLWNAAKKAGGYALDHLIHDNLANITGNAEYLGADRFYCDGVPVNSALQVHRKPTIVYSIEKSESKDEVKSEDDLPLTHLSAATKTVNALTDPPEMVTPKNARRPSLTLSITSRKK